MKMPLIVGLPLLAALLLAADLVASPALQGAVLAAAMGVALWTAFSLKIPPRTPRKPEEELVRPEDDEPESPQPGGGGPGGKAAG